MKNKINTDYFIPENFIKKFPKAIFYVIIGDRSRRKTYNITKFLLKQKKPALMILPYKTTIKELRGNVLSELAVHDPKEVLKFGEDNKGVFKKSKSFDPSQKKVYQIRLASLSTADDIKRLRAVISQFEWGVADEFMLLKFPWFYDALVKVLGTNDNPNFKLFMPSNSETLDNIFFNKWGVTNLEKTYTVVNNSDSKIVIYKMEASSTEHKNKMLAKPASILGRFTNYNRHAIHNEFAYDDLKYVETISKMGMKFQYIIILDQVTIGYWSGHNIYFFCLSFNKTGKRYTFKQDLKDSNITVLPIEVLNSFYENYKNGNVRFETLQIKNQFKVLFKNIVKEK